MQELVRVKYTEDHGGLVQGTIVTIDKSKASVLVSRGIVKMIDPTSSTTNKSFADKQDLIKRA
jgi:hypothetical protein